MTPNLLDELERVARLMDAATQGEWYWNEHTANLVTDKPGDGQEFEIASVYSEHDDDREPANSAAICAAIHFLRTCAPAIADMAKRTEALQYLAAAMYQAAGAYDMPARLLDVLSAAGNGGPITEAQVDALLPCETPDTLQRLEAAERDAYMAGYVQGCNDQACVGLNQGELLEDAMRAADHAGYTTAATQEGER